ncbi:PIR protein [Plasmodium vivax]|uniref:VIR protein n=1 Tax=Plasmodium vivax TaxID=5855 RepID=A0A565A3I4_PLAVI|nr:PIR protein [Plasmodium vivax]
MGVEASLDEFEFFEKMDMNYLYKAVNSVNDGTVVEGDTEIRSYIDCTAFRGLDKDICKRFNNLIKSLCFIKSTSDNNKLLNNNDYLYLNFWANSEVYKKGGDDNATVDEFSINMKDECKTCFDKITLKKMLKYIDDKTFEKMKILDNLYNNYFEMEQIIFSKADTDIEKCSSYSKQCVEHYTAAISKYRDTKDHFYNALKNFENKHKNLHNQAFQRNKSLSAYMEMIPKAYQISDLTSYTMNDENNKIILISLLGSASAIILILIYFYMFTPCCARMPYMKGNKKKKIRNQDDIRDNSLQYLADSNNVGFNNKKYNLAYQTA